MGDDDKPSTRTFQRHKPEWDDKPTVKAFPAVTPGTPRDADPEVARLRVAMMELLSIVEELGGNVEGVRTLLKKKS